MIPVALLWVVGLAHGADDGEEDELEEIEVVGDRRPLEVSSAAQVTVVEVDERLPGSADVATAVERAPGATVTRLGGLGSFASVGIRGSAARQVEVMLDGVPLNPEGGAVVDLSELPLRAFERVEVYRGAAPPELGSAAIGGVVNLVTGEGDPSVALGGGSWGSARATGAASGSGTLGDTWLALDALSTSGRFRFLDDGGTRLETSDDELRVRRNNDVRQVAAHGRWRAAISERVELSVLDAFLVRDQGIAGFTSDPASAARYGVVRNLLAVQGEGTTGAARWRVRPWGTARIDRLADPLAELGVGGPDDRRDRTLAAGLHGHGGWAATPSARLDATVDLRTEATGPASDALRGRQVLRGIAATVWSPSSGLTVTPAVAGLILVDGDDALTRSFGLPRVSAVLAGGPWAVTTTAGVFARPPDLLELYGDRGAVVGNPDLRPERSVQGDLGLAWHHHDAHAEVVGFHRRVTDLIALEQTAQGVARPDNVDLATVTGIEAATEASGDVGWLGANLTAQEARDLSDDPTYAGNQLPRVPRVAVGVRTGLTPGPVRVSGDLTWTAGTWLDRANFTRQAPRPLVGATLAVRDRTGIWWVELDVRNVADRIVQPLPADPLVADSPLVQRPVEDLLGFPLPGRTAWLTVRWMPRAAP